MIKIDVHKKLASASGEMQFAVNTTIPTKQLLTLYGKSGAGKTTLLRILAGLTEVDHGRILVNEKLWLDTEKNINISPQQRGIGFVFQDYALFPNMSVQQNLSFALQKGDDQTIIKELIDIMELGDLRNERPSTLSGGQQQRVALARALVQRPSILLLDEPLSALDLEMRSKLQSYLLKVHQTYDLTTILVSHDESEIRKLSKEVLILNNGKVLKRGKVSKLFPLTETTLTGEIIALQREEEICKVIVAIGANKVSITTSLEQAKSYNIGDSISVNSHLKLP